MKTRQKLVFDVGNGRIVTEDDSVNVMYTDILECPISVIQKVVDIHNENISGNNTPEIDQYLMDEALCTQEDREEIVENFYLYYFSTSN